MVKPIQGGPVMDAAKSVVDLIFRGLDSCLRDLNDHGLEKKKEEDIEKDGLPGKYLMYETNSGHIIEVELFGKSDAKDKYLLCIRHDEAGQPTIPKQLFSKSEISDYIMNYAADKGLISDDLNDDEDVLTEGIDVNNNVGMEEDELFQSTKISVTLKKVTASDNSTDIHLCAINAGGNPVRAMKVLADVLDDDEFVATITEEPVSFEITETASDYDVEESSGVDTSETFREMLRACVECYHNLQSIHWSAKSNQFNELHTYVESLVWDIQYNIDTIAEWCIEFTKHCPNVLSYSYQPIDCSDGFDFDSGIAAAKSQIDIYIDVLECYYVNLEHDVQSIVDEWLRNLKKKSNYIMSRCLTQ